MLHASREAPLPSEDPFDTLYSFRVWSLLRLVPSYIHVPIQILEPNESGAFTGEPTLSIKP
jgi:hypothetical protein